MHGKFYHRACFQSKWREGFEGEGCYYSPLRGCPLQRGSRHTAVHPLAWRPRDPDSPDDVETHSYENNSVGSVFSLISYSENVTI